MLTLGDCWADAGLQRVVGYAQGSTDFTSLVNDSVRRILRRGDFSNVVQPIFVGVYNGCVAWPRHVGKLRRVNVCNRPVQVDNLWYRFMERGQGHPWNSWMGADCTPAIEQEGTTPVQQDIQGDGRYIQAYWRALADISMGASITFYGVDNNNNPLQTLNADGSLTSGITLKAQAPYARSALFVRRIDRVIKSSTQGLVDVYAFNSGTGLLEDIAHYDPGDTRPEFIKTRVKLNFPCCASAANPACGGALRGILALVKLKYVPANNPNDWIVIDNLDALKLEIQAIKAREGGDIQGAFASRTEATKEMNLQLADDVPDEQFAASDCTFGRSGRKLTNHCF